MLDYFPRCWKYLDFKQFQCLEFCPGLLESFAGNNFFCLYLEAFFFVFLSQVQSVWS